MAEGGQEVKDDHCDKASVKLLIKMAVKAEEEEAGVLSMVELLSQVYILHGDPVYFPSL